MSKYRNLPNKSAAITELNAIVVVVLTISGNVYAQDCSSIDANSKKCITLGERPVLETKTFGAQRSWRFHNRCSCNITVYVTTMEKKAGNAERHEIPWSIPANRSYRVECNDAAGCFGFVSFREECKTSRSQNFDNRPQDRNSITFELNSHDPFPLEVTYVSRDRNYQWPGSGRIYVISSSTPRIDKLRCRKGEKICYGIWRRGNANVSWGAGYLGRESCADCCWVCGSGKHPINLSAFSGTEVDGNPDAAAAVLQGLASGLILGRQTKYRIPRASQTSPRAVMQPSRPTSGGAGRGGNCAGATIAVDENCRPLH